MQTRFFKTKLFAITTIWLRLSFVLVLQWKDSLIIIMFNNELDYYLVYFTSLYQFQRVAGHCKNIYFSSEIEIIEKILWSNFFTMLWKFFDMCDLNFFFFNCCYFLPLLKIHISVFFSHNCCMSIHICIRKNEFVTHMGLLSDWARIDY